jgi:hypothetical protein
VPTWAQNSLYFRKGALLVGDVTYAKIRNDDLKIVALKRQILSIGVHKGCISNSSAREFEHGAGKIRASDLATSLYQRLCDIPMAATEVEHIVSRLNTCSGQERLNDFI